MAFVDRAKLIENLDRFAPEHITPLIRSLIEKQPTADVVEVVRCGKCKHRIEIYRGAYGCSLEPTQKYVQLCHFCSYGERRTE